MNANALTSYINGFNHGGSGKLTAVIEDNNVVVTGTVTGVSNTLKLYLDAYISVKWKANYSGTADLILLSSCESSGKEGFFTVYKNYTLHSFTGVAIINDGVIITIEGTVSSSDNCAVLNGNRGLIAIEGGMVRSYNNHAISNNGSGGIVELLSGTVQSGGNKAAIYNAYPIPGMHHGYSEPSKVQINGGLVVNGGNGDAILNAGGRLFIRNGKVQCEGQGSAIRNDTLAGTGVVEISGGTVQTDGNGSAISNVCDGRISINGTASVTAQGAGRAIHNNAKGTITISGNSVVSSKSGIAIDISENGQVTVSENAKITSSNSGPFATIFMFTNGTENRLTLEITGGTIENKADGAGGPAIRNNGKGEVKISGGTVSSKIDAIINNSSGVLNITGGSVISTTTANKSAIYNPGTGAINISGGSVSGGNGYAVYNAGNGKITVSDNAKIISSGDNSTICLAESSTATTVLLAVSGGKIENTSTVSGGSAIRNNGKGEVIISKGTVRSKGDAIRNYSTGKLTVTGGSVISTTTANKSAIYNPGTGSISISGGSIFGRKGYAVYSVGNGRITISDNAHLFTSGDNSAICLADGSTVDTVLLSVTGGTIENISTGLGGSAIRNNGKGAVRIDGGTVRSNRDVIRNYSTGDLTINGGSITTTSEDKSAIYTPGTGKVRITGGAVSGGNGYAVYNAGNSEITVSGDAHLITSGDHSTIYLAESSTVTTLLLVVTGGTIESVSVGPGGSAIRNNGKGIVRISGGTVRSSVDAIRNYSAGALLIDGGSVSTTTTADKSAIYNPGAGEVIISGGSVSGGKGYAVYNAGNGTITVSDNAKIISSGNKSTICLANSCTTTSQLLSITGGTIENTSLGFAIENASSASISLSNGMVLAKKGFAVRTSGTGNIKNDGGLIFAFGSCLGDVIDNNTVPTGNGRVIAWDYSANYSSNVSFYGIGSNTHIYKFPESVVAVWAISGGNNGIAVFFNDLINFIPVADINISN